MPECIHREGPSADPAAASGPGARAGLRARSPGALQGGCPRPGRGADGGAVRPAEPFHGPAAPPRAWARRRARPAARRTPPCGDQRRALRPPHR